MTVINLYNYAREDGGITISPIKPKNTECVLEYRLIADEGMILIKENIETFCIDVTTPEGWTEKPAPQEELNDEH